MPSSTRAHLARSAAVDRLTLPIADRVPRSWPAGLAALENRNYRLFLSAQAVGSIGGWMQRVAQDWMVLQLTGSVAAVGFTVALQFAPFLFFGLFSGLLADRYPKLVLIRICQSVAALCALTLGVLALTGQAQAWHVYVIAVVLGLAMVVDGPARSALVTELVGKHRIGNAVSLNSSVFHSAALIGPALSGVLISQFGLGWSFIANAVAVSTVVLMLFAVRPAITQLPTVASRASGQLREGLAYIRRTSEVRWALLLVGVSGLFTMNMTVVLSAFADKVHHLGVTGYSLFTAMNAVGALGGALLSANRRTPLRLRGLALLLGLLGLVMALGALATTPTMFAVTLVFGGLITLTFLIAANTLVQTAAAPAVRGRVMSVYILVQMGSQAIAGPVLGVAMDHFGPQSALLVKGLAATVFAVVLAVGMARESDLKLALSRLHRRDFHLDPVRLGPATVPAVTARTLWRCVPLEIVHREDDSARGRALVA